MTLLDALRATLTAEHAAAYTYATLGARTSASSEPKLSEALRGASQTHRAYRDQLSLLVIDAGGTPVAAAAAYDLPVLTTSAEIRTAAQGVEQACSAAYASQVQNTTGEPRAWAVDALTWSAVQTVRVGGPVIAWPGATELS
jgi:hypothetical protein